MPDPTIQRLSQLYGLRIQKRTYTLDHVSLTTAGGSQVFSFAASLPASAFVVGSDLVITEGFTDGAAGVFSADLGIKTTDEDCLLATAALASIATVGQPLGVQPVGYFGAQLPALTIKATVNVDTATAGTVKAEIYYFDCSQVLTP